MTPLPQYEEMVLTPHGYSTPITYSTANPYTSPTYSTPAYTTPHDYNTPPPHSSTPDWVGTSDTGSERSSPVRSIDGKDRVTTPDRKKKPAKSRRVKRNSSSARQAIRITLSVGPLHYHYQLTATMCVRQNFTLVS